MADVTDRNYTEVTAPNTAQGARVSHPRSRVGVVASFDFDRDREIWRWAPETASLFIARTDPVTFSDNLELVSSLNRPRCVDRPTREVCAIGSQVVTYLCTACSFVGGAAGERALRKAMRSAGAPQALTSAGSVVAALGALEARRIAVVHPYEPPVGRRLHEYLTGEGLEVLSLTDLGLGSVHEIYEVSYEQVTAAVRAGVHPQADAVFISCTALPTYDLIAPLEEELGKPVVTVNQATIWAALRAVGERAVGPRQQLLTV
ncbi:Asp/Glu racemase [Streptomyces sp. NPDC015125]|uniref:maleate cis-trans isomerase family protein n=1 Tax=Streptomyces sp. NPDC015125 TaxID=3364938 RepID=UPI0036F93B67